jgi:hypothetical protein
MANPVKPVREDTGIGSILTLKKHSHDHEGNIGRRPEDSLIQREEAGLKGIKRITVESAIANPDFLNQGSHCEKKA